MGNPLKPGKGTKDKKNPVNAHKRQSVTEYLTRLGIPPSNTNELFLERILQILASLASDVHDVNSKEDLFDVYITLIGDNCIPTSSFNGLNMTFRATDSTGTTRGLVGSIQVSGSGSSRFLGTATSSIAGYDAADLATKTTSVSSAAQSDANSSAGTSSSSSSSSSA